MPPVTYTTIRKGSTSQTRWTRWRELTHRAMSFPPHTITLDVDGNIGSGIIEAYETIWGGNISLGEAEVLQSGPTLLALQPGTGSIRLRLGYWKCYIKRLCITKKEMVSETYLVEVCGDRGDRYRFGLNGIEKANEVAGVGNHYTAQFGEYSPRIARRWNQDPKPNVSVSNYAIFANSPIWHSDILLDTPRALSTHRLREMAIEAGATGTGVNFNRQAGKMFENVALHSQGFIYGDNKKPYFSADRKSMTFGKSSTVIPDGVRSVSETRLQTFWGIPYGTSKATYPESSFFEVKAVDGFIRLSSSKYQIHGELDALSNSIGAKIAGRGTMTFITTTNTFIHPNVIAYADRKHIQLYQAFAFEETDDGSIRFTPPIPLNNPRTGRSMPINVTPVGKIFDLSRAYYLNSSIPAEPPGTQDPEEVE